MFLNRFVFLILCVVLVSNELGGAADQVDMTTPEFRMGLENYYAKFNSDTLLSRPEVRELVEKFENQMSCAQKSLPQTQLKGADWAWMNKVAEQFKNSPYS